MSFFTFSGIKIKAVHSTVPAHKVPASSRDNINGRHSEEQRQKVTGINNLHIAQEGLTTTDLMENSLQKILSILNWDKNTIDILCCVTQTPDYLSPGNSFLLHDRLGLSHSTLCLDLSHGCTGFTHGLTIVAGLLSCHPGKRALLCVGDTLSRQVSELDPSTSAVFGDGVSVIALEQSLENTKVYAGAYSKGKGLGSLYIPQPDAPSNNITMNGMAVTSFTLAEVPQAINNTLRYAQKNIQDIDQVILHQPNAFLLNSLAKKLKIPSQKLLSSLGDYGNTSGASIPITLSTNFAPAHPVEISGTYLFGGFGIGLSISIVVMEISGAIILPVDEI